MQNQFLNQYVMLAEIAYADFPGITLRNQVSDEIKEALIKSKFIKKDALDQLDFFQSSWHIVTQWEQPKNLANSGFSATLFKSIPGAGESPKYVLALRGTTSTAPHDLSTDIGDIWGDGIAHRQIVDMYNFWQRIAGDGGNLVLKDLE